MFVFLHQHLRFQTAETAALTSLLCAECSTLKASPMGWNHILVQLPVLVSFCFQNTHL